MCVSRRNFKNKEKSAEMENNCRETEKLLIAYTAGDLEPGMQEEVKKHLEQCMECKKEADRISRLFDMIGSYPQETPPANIKTSFYAMLDEEKCNTVLKEKSIKGGERKTGNRVPLLPFWIQIAAGVALLIAGMFAGSLLSHHRGVTESQSEIAALQQDIKEMKQLVVFSLLRQESASERIKAVSYAMEFTEPDVKLTEALFYTLNYDPNVNVRLSAIQALSNFPASGKIRSGLIEALENQDDPMVQIMLINTLVGMAEREALQQLKRLAEDEKTLDIVRQHAEDGIKTLI